MRVTIFEGTIVKFKSGRYQYAEITCHSDFTAPRLVIYTYKKSTRWSLTFIRPAGNCCGQTRPPPPPPLLSNPRSQHQQLRSQPCSNTRHRVLRIEAEMHALDDLFHFAPARSAADPSRSSKRPKLLASNARHGARGWFRKSDGNRCPSLEPDQTESDPIGTGFQVGGLHRTLRSGFRIHDERTDDSCTCEVSLNNPSQPDLEPPATAAPVSRTGLSNSTNSSTGELSVLELFLESGQTCSLHLESGPSRDQCVRALHCILSKNRLIRGYPDIDYTWSIRLRYKMQKSPTSSVTLLLPRVAGTAEQRLFCLTASEFLIVHGSLCAPELICPYSFVRQCASRKDGQFRIQLGRASPLGESELVIRLVDATEARFVHEAFVRLMTDSAARNRDGRSSSAIDLSTEFTTNFPPLPRPTTLISTTTGSNNDNNKNNAVEIDRSRVRCDPNSGDSDEPNREPLRSRLTMNSGQNLQNRVTSTTHRSVNNLSSRNSWPQLRMKRRPEPRRLPASSQQHANEPNPTGGVKPQNLEGRRTHSLETFVCSIAEASPVCAETKLSGTTLEAFNHYLEMTDSFEVWPTRGRPARSSHSDRTSMRVIVSGFSAQPRCSSFSNGHSDHTVTSLLPMLRQRLNAVRATKRSSPVVSSPANCSSRPTSHREDDMLFANVIYDPEPRMDPSSIFGAIPLNLQQHSATVVHESDKSRPADLFTMCTHQAHARLRSMSDVTALRPQVHTAACHSLHNPEHHWSPMDLQCAQPTLELCYRLRQTNQTVRERNRSATNRFSFSSFLSSAVNSSTRNSCLATSTTTPASCSNLKTSHDLIDIREIVGREQSTEKQMRPRASTVGPSLLLGQRPGTTSQPADPWIGPQLVHLASARAEWTNCDAPAAILAKDAHTLIRSTRKVNACPLVDQHQAKAGDRLRPADTPYTPFSFSDHYVL